MQTSPEPPKTKAKTKKGKVKTFTDTHGMVPDIYVPAWKTNVVSEIFDYLPRVKGEALI